MLEYPNNDEQIDILIQPIETIGDTSTTINVLLPFIVYTYYYVLTLKTQHEFSNFSYVNQQK